MRQTGSQDFFGAENANGQLPLNRNTRKGIKLDKAAARQPRQPADKSKIAAKSRSAPARIRAKSPPKTQPSN